MSKAEQAASLIKNHTMNCAQTIFSIFCEDFGLDRKTALKIASGFGGGMARTGKTCGAVTGAYMVLGLAGQMSPEKPRAGMDSVESQIREFNRRFKKRHGSLLCKTLLGVDLNTPGEPVEARKKNLSTTVCQNLVRDSARILEELLNQK